MFGSIASPAGGVQNDSAGSVSDQRNVRPSGSTAGTGKLCTPEGPTSTIGARLETGDALLGAANEISVLSP